MKSKIVLLFAIILNFVCQAQTTVQRSFTHDGINRTYSIYIPATYNSSQAVPLVINLHGHTSTGAQQSLYANFEPIADTANFIIVHPDGTVNPSTNTTFWNIGIVGATVNDVSFLSDLIDTISANYAIQQDRIYSVGMSNGGYMSYLLACQTDKLRAIGSVTGSMTNYMYNNCPANAALPVIQIHGTSDLVVPYAGDTTSKPIEEVIENWVNRNSCNTTPSITAIANTNTSDNSTAERYEYANGTNGNTVEFFKITGGGHTWPGAMAIPAYGNTNQDFSASKEIWRFFSQFNQAEVRINTEELEKIVLSPNPTTGRLSITGINIPTKVEILDIQGKIIENHSINTATTIDLSHLNPGIYFCKILTGNSNSTHQIVLH